MAKYTEQQIKKMINDVIEEIENQMQAQIESDFEASFRQLVDESVDSFYDDYPPKKYVRTDAFRVGAKEGVQFIKSGDGIDIILTSDYVPEHPGWKKDGSQPYSGENIWEDAFVEGIHGTRSVAVMEESPYLLVKKKAQEVYDRAFYNAKKKILG